MLSKHLILTWAYNCRLRSTVRPWERLHLCFLESSAALRSPMHSGTLCVLLCKISSSWGFPFTVTWLLLWIFVCLFASFFFGLLFWLWISGPFHQNNFKILFLKWFLPSLILCSLCLGFLTVWPLDLLDGSSHFYYLCLPVFQLLFFCSAFWEISLIFLPILLWEKSLISVKYFISNSCFCLS